MSVTQGAGEVWRKALGAYYTPSDAAHFIASWLVRRDGETIVEPSLGDGAFVAAAAEAAARQGFARPDFLAAEINPTAITGAVAAGVVATDEVSAGDFLLLPPRPADAVIGNPPYVRLRSLTEPQRRAADAASARVLGRPTAESGSVWMPFVLHAISFLKPDGRLALVLPWDMTYVRYARPLWSYLGRTFGSLEVVRVRQRLFPDISQDVLILLADHKGRSTTDLEFTVYESLSEIDRDRPTVRRRLLLDDIVRGERVFQRAFLPADVLDLLQGDVAAATAPVRDYADFHIGYVSGNKPYFHPDAGTVRKYRLPESSLRPALTTGRGLRGVGLHSSRTPDAIADRLWHPPDSITRLTKGERAYRADGEAAGVHLGHKCRHRTPWHRVPDVRVPDLLLGAFASRPTLMINDAGFVASNTLLCGYLRDPKQARRFVASWYSALTLLSVELEVHSLGGGVLVLVPQETGNVRLPRLGSISTSTLTAVDRALRRDDGEAAYAAGDNAIAARFGRDALALIREAIDTLDAWRTNSG